jgi:methylenetetrahydrofolate reductase (NADH)
VFFGAAENPNVEPLGYRALRLAKKVAAGAQFIQTQYCFDMPLLRGFMRAVEDAGLKQQAFILVGVGPLRSAKAAEWMRAHVPGMHIPDAVIARLAGAADQAREGRNLCVDLIQEIRSINGVAGVHVMAYRQEESVAEVIDRSGVLAGRAPWHPERDQSISSDRKAS